MANMFLHPGDEALGCIEMMLTQWSSYYAYRKIAAHYKMEPEIKDTYFRKFIVPIVISVVVLLGIVVILTTPPGTPPQWDTFAKALTRPIAGGGRWR
jgi:hypothetical protein